MPTPLFFHDTDYRGMGVSTGLARGLQVKVQGMDLTQEGMGLGAVAIRAQGKTYFARDHQVTQAAPQRLVQDCLIDAVHLSGTDGRCDRLINQARESLSSLYRLAPPLQTPFLQAGAVLRDILGIKSRFHPVEPQAQARFHFQLHPWRVDVRCEFRALAEPPQELYIMNELGADFFTSAWHSGQNTRAPLGWQVCPDNGNLPFLYSPRTGSRYSLRDIQVSGDLPFKVCWGREKTEELCWAGFTIRVHPARKRVTDLVCSYSIIFANDRG